jgi:ABC-2 type transport system ATP-binding protein
MTRAAPLVVGKAAAWAALAILIAAVGLPATAAPTAPTFLSLALGALAGAALFAALARRPVPVVRIPRARLPSLAARVLYLLERSVLEEIVWRGVVFVALLGALGFPVALLVSTLAFAASHLRRQGRRAWVHLLTGAVFALVFHATGRLSAAFAAHAAYNLLVVAALELERATPTQSLRSLPVPAAAAGDNAPARLRQVSKRFGSVEALRAVELEVGEGEIVALLGRNGAGKTTAVGLLLGLRRPDRGESTLFGRPPRDTAARRLVGSSPQEIAFPWTLRVRDVLDLVRAHFAAPRRTADLVAEFGLSGLERRQTGSLSGGQRRRLALALAFAGNPRLLILDEPTATLDVETRRRVWTSVREFARGGGAVLLTTHQLDEAEALATRVVVIDAGRVLASGAPGELRDSAGLACVRLRSAHPLPGLDYLVRIERDGNDYALFTRSPDKLLADLSGHGIPVSDVAVRPLSLEEAFLALVEAP